MPGSAWGKKGKGTEQSAGSPELPCDLPQLCREAQVSQKMKTMTLKESKKEEKADREFQKKFKVSGKERLLSPLHPPSAPGRARAAAERSCALQTPAPTRLPPAPLPAETAPAQALRLGGICSPRAGAAAGAARLALPWGGCRAAAPPFAFQFEGSISVLTQMMVDPAATEKRGRGKNLPLRRGEILDVIQFTDEEQILCRNSQRKCKGGVRGCARSRGHGAQSFGNEFLHAPGERETPSAWRQTALPAALALRRARSSPHARPALPRPAQQQPLCWARLPARFPEPLGRPPGTEALLPVLPEGCPGEAGCGPPRQGDGIRLCQPAPAQPGSLMPPLGHCPGQGPPKGPRWLWPGSSLPPAPAGGCEVLLSPAWPGQGWVLG